MIGIPFKDWVNSEYGLTAADKERAASDLKTSASNIYRMAQTNDHFVYVSDKTVRIYKLKLELKKGE